MSRIIIVDADGMLINTEMFSKQYSRKTGISEDLMTPFFLGPFQECIVGRKNIEEALEPYLPKWKWNGTVNEFLQAWFEAENTTDQDLVQEIRARKEKGFKFYLATNQEARRLTYFREEMGFTTLFDGIFCSAEIGYKKSQREFHQYIYDHLSRNREIDKNQIMFWDDEQSNVVVAKEFGFDGKLYSNISEFISAIDS